MDRSVEARLHDLQSRRDKLSTEVEGLLKKLEEARSQRDALGEVMRRIEREVREDRRAALSEEGWRRAVRQLGTFTVSELAAELSVSNATATKHLKAMAAAGLVKAAGRVLGKPLYEYIRPTDAGEAYEQQQERRLRIVEDPPEEVTTVIVAERGLGVAQSLLSSIATKEIREVAREAISKGWTLENIGGKHIMALRKDGRIIRLVSSPRNAGDAAQQLRQRLYGERAARIAR